MDADALYGVGDTSESEENNTYLKYAPNVFLAKCEKEHAKGDRIPVKTKGGKIHICIVYNFIGTKDGFPCYSITREDKYNRAQAKAERYQEWAKSRDEKSEHYYNQSRKDAEFLSLGEPIKIGHHSEKRHRKAYEDMDNNMRRSIENGDKAKDHRYKAAYWAEKADEINLSMPESLEYFQELLQKAEEKHKNLKDGTAPREHAYSLTYAKNEVNKLKKQVELSKKLWG